MSMTAFGGIIELPRRMFTVGMGSGCSLDADGEYVAFIMKVPKTGTLKKVGFHTGNVTTADTINVRIETVSDSDGYPTGTLYDANATGSQESPAANTSYLVAINGSSGISVTKGDIIAIKIKLDYVDGNLVIWHTTSGNEYTGVSFPYVVTYLNSSLAKSTPYRLAVMMIYDGEVIATPNCLLPSSYVSVSVKSSSSPDHYGMAITPPFTCRCVGAWVAMDNDNPVDLILYDSDGATALQTLSLPNPDIRGSTTLFIQYHLFTTPQTLTKGSKYRIVMNPTKDLYISSQYLMFPDDGSLYGIDQMDLGQNAHYTVCTDTPTGEGSWTNDLTKRPMMGLLIDAVDIPSSSSGLAGSILRSPIVGRC